MFRIASLTLAFFLATVLAQDHAKAEASEFDGRWSLEIANGCRPLEGRFEAVIENGRLKADIHNSGRIENLTGTVDVGGKLREGRLGFRMFNGRFDGDSGIGVMQFRNHCLAGWTMTLIERAQSAPAAEQSAAAATAAPAEDDTPPIIEAPGALATDGPVVEFAGRVSDNSAIVEFTVNGAATALGSDGSFNIRRGVAQGESELVIAALDEWGNRAERRVHVTRSAESVTRGSEATAETGDSSAPMIAVLPALETDDPIIEITGAIVDSSAIIDVTVAGGQVALNPDGSFAIRRGVPVGESEVVVSALDEWGNEAEKVIRVTRRAPEPAAEAAPEEPQSAAIIEAERDGEAPRITLPPKLVTEGPEIDITGTVADDSAVTDMLVNERPITLRADGSFRVRQNLKVGSNKFAFTAIDEWGNKATATIDVLRKPLDLALGDYHALVIGNNDYGDMPKLKTAIADAEAVSEVLESRYGFTVTKLINATRFDVISAMSGLRAKLSYDTNLLVYYAGHGVVDPVTERGYWLPVDAHQDISANWVSNDDITDMLKAIPARHILVIADSCYSGTLVRAAPVSFDTWEDRRDWLRRIVKKRSRTALASGGLEPVADSGGGNHSVFAAALLGVLRDNTETVEAQALFEPVRKKVVLNANQTPVYSDIRLAGHDGGDFIFAPR